MPARVIRNGLIDSEVIAALHDRTFRLYVHLLLSADDYGLVETDFGPIRRAAPLLDWNRELVAKMLIELVDAALVLPYEVAGKHYAAIARWRSSINSLTPKHPMPQFGMGHVLTPYKFKSQHVREEAAKIISHIKEVASGSDTPVTPQRGASARRGKGEEGKSTTAAKAPAKKGDGEYSAVFLQALNEYPKRHGDNPSARAWKAWRANLAHYTEDEMLHGIRRYAAFVRATGIEGTKYVKQAATLLGPDKGFLEPWACEATHSAGQNLSAAKRLSV